MTRRAPTSSTPNRRFALVTGEHVAIYEAPVRGRGIISGCLRQVAVYERGPEMTRLDIEAARIAPETPFADTPESA